MMEFIRQQKVTSFHEITQILLGDGSNFIASLWEWFLIVGVWGVRELCVWVGVGDRWACWEAKVSLNNSGSVFIWNRLVPDILRTLSSTAVQFLDDDFTLKPENSPTETGCCFQTEPHLPLHRPGRTVCIKTVSAWGVTEWICAEEDDKLPGWWQTQKLRKRGWCFPQALVLHLLV